MLTKVRLLWIIVLGFTGWGASCNHEACDGEVPTLGYLKEALIPAADSTGFDTLLLTFDFFDCDGDIGLNSEDTTGDFAPGEYYHYNLYMDYYEWSDTGWTLVEFPGGGFRYRVPRLESEGRYPELEGEIDVKVTLEPVLADTFRFEAKLIDRARNESELTTTADYVFP